MTDYTAGLITGAGTVEFRPFAASAPGSGCVTVAVTLCGICGTEIAAYRTGHLHQPAVCGHEWVGTVTAVGAEVEGLAERDRVVVGVPAPCGRCPECSCGLGEHCRSVSYVARGRTPLAPPHGGFAPSITVEAGRVIPCHPGLTDDQAAQVEPATVAFHGIRRSGITPGDTVVVQGAGPIGLFAAQFARAAGAGVVLVVEPNPRRRDLALELGASTAVAPEQAADAVLDGTRGVGADVVMECSGVPALLQAAADLTRSGGTVGLLSFAAQEAPIQMARWLAKELRLVASNAFGRDDFRRSMAMLADGRVRTEPMHTRTVPLDQLAATMRDLADGATDDVNVLVDPTGR